MNILERSRSNNVGARRAVPLRHRAMPLLRRVVRHLKTAVTILAVLLAAAIVVSVTVDLGPYARQYAERAGSDYIERPLHIGSLRIHLLTGKVLVEDVRIDGLQEHDRPFFTAKHISVSLDWLPAFRSKPDFVITAVDMSD